MEIVIYTNNSKVKHFYQETNEVRFQTKQDLISLLEDVKVAVDRGCRILSDPIYSCLESPENPYKSIAVTKETYDDNEDQQKMIEGSISIAKKIENRKKFFDFKEENLEQYRFIDLNLLRDFITKFEVWTR